MRFVRAASVTVASIVTVSALGCSSRDNPQVPAATNSASESPAKELSARDYDPANFDSSSTTIDNAWFPLRPGTQFVYEGGNADGDQHRVVFTVTDMTKVIDGVRTLVIWDRDYSSNELVETELAMFAQDVDGNVWHFGQYPEEYENGKFVRAPSWVHGFEGGRAGISMKETPALDAHSYAQGFAPPPINWIDRARVYKMGVSNCVPVDCYENVLIAEEFERDKPGAFQLKYYAPDVGNIRVGWRGRNEKERETLVLVDLLHLSAEEMAEVRRGALALEENAYQVSTDVWALTPPLEPL